MARKQMNGLDLTGQKIVNLADPSSSTDAVTKQYVDNIAAGLDAHQSVRAATTANLTLSAPQTIDGVSVIAGDRVLVKDQTTASANGIYVAAAGAWALATDSVNGKLSAGAFVSVEEGTVNGDKSFVLTTNNPIVVGTTSLVWSPFSAGTTYTAGNGLSLSSGTFAVVPGSGILADGTSTRIDPAYAGLAKRYAVNVPNGSTTATITHNLGTLDVAVTVFEISGGAEVDCDVVHATTTTVTLGFAVAPTTGQYRAVIVG